MAETVPVVGWSEKARRAVDVEIDAERIRCELGALRAGISEEIGDQASRGQVPGKNPAVPAIGRWAAVVLEGDLADARRALAPLLAARAGVAWNGGPEPGLLAIERPDTDTNTDRWIKRLRRTAGASMPHNLLLVGGPDRFPYEVQRALDQVFRTGRLDGGGPDGKIDWNACAAYAEKVARHEAGRGQVTPDALLFSFATDEATRQAHNGLSTPLRDYLADQAGRKDWVTRSGPPRELFQDAATSRGLAQVLAASRPAIVFTMSHGVEDPVDPGRWGALTDVTCLGPAGDAPLSAASVATLPACAEGSIFFAFACFSAGVPQSSIFSTAKADGTRPAIDGAPLTAPLARALLAHPRGPVAFIGHVDRVTNRCFTNSVLGAGLQPFTDFLDWSLGGAGTLGQAMSTFHELGTTTLTGLVRHLSPLGSPHTPPSDAELVDLWQRYYDYSGFLLMGDPAIEVRV